jgi:hypothetical protein
MKLLSHDALAYRKTFSVRWPTTITVLAAFCWHKTSPCEILNTVRGHAEKVQDMTTRGNSRTPFLHLLHAKFPVFSAALTKGDTNTARGKESEEKPHGPYDKGREIKKENLPAAIPHPSPHPCTTDTVSVYKCTVTALEHSVVIHPTLHCLTKKNTAFWHEVSGKSETR